MSLEDQHPDRKSLRTIVGKRADWDDIAKACVCFANGAGGRLLIGIEDGDALPPATQVVPVDLLDRLRKQITLGALAQTEGMTARELAAMLETGSAVELAPWLGRLVEGGGNRR